MTVALLAVVVFVGSGCSTRNAHTTARSSVLRVAMDDFHLRLSTRHLRAGPTVVEIGNAGPTVHEAVIKRSSVAASRWPMDASGIRLNETDTSLKSVLDVSNVDLGEHVQRIVNLTPGHYVAFCNLPGHFLGGMYAEFEVTRHGAVS